MSEDTLNVRLMAKLKCWGDRGVNEHSEAVVMLEEYQRLAQKEVDGAKGERNLQLHNTTRAIYEEQIEVIDEIFDEIEDDYDPAESVKKLIELLDSGEAIG